VKVPTDRPSEHWIYIPALLVVGFVWLMQGLRTRGAKPRLRRRQAA
jgi:hypothetical protein